MFCSRKSKLRLENIFKQTLGVALNEYEKNYNDLLLDEDGISIHMKLGHKKYHLFFCQQYFFHKLNGSY